jgi:AhpD family alkylhydroperoxidase
VRFDPYAADTAAYAHLLALAQHLGQSGLDPSIRALVEVRVSQISGCAFCLGFHTASARRFGVAEKKLDLLAGWRDAPIFDHRDRAALALGEEMARIGDGMRVDGPTWSAVRTAFSDSEISSLLYTVGLIKVWNLLNVTCEFPADGRLPVSAPRGPHPGL